MSASVYIERYAQLRGKIHLPLKEAHRIFRGRAEFDRGFIQVKVTQTDQPLLQIAHGFAFHAALKRRVGRGCGRRDRRGGRGGRWRGRYVNGLHVSFRRSLGERKRGNSSDVHIPGLLGRFCVAAAGKQHGARYHERHKKRKSASQNQLAAQGKPAQRAGGAQPRAPRSLQEAAPCAVQVFKKCLHRVSSVQSSCGAAAGADNPFPIF